MSTTPVSVGGESLRELGDALHVAGHEFWKGCNREAGGGAVRWVAYDDGTLIVFTRGEYRDTLMNNVHTLPGIPTLVFDQKSDEEDRGFVAAESAPTPPQGEGKPRTPAEWTLAGCRCVLFGKGNPHWPCALHPGGQGEGKQKGGLPVELFDGFGVFNMLKPEAKRRTSPENVSDVLDAVVRLINRADALASQGSGGDEGMVLVPREPTPEMVEAICANHTKARWPRDFGSSAQGVRRDYARAGYIAALAASPVDGRKQP